MSENVLSVVVSIEDLRCAVTALEELVRAGRHHQESDEPALARLREAIAKKENRDD